MIKGREDWRFLGSYKQLELQMSTGELLFAKTFLSTAPLSIAGQARQGRTFFRH